MKEKIRQCALELGFDYCRFSSAASPSSAPQFQNWLAEKKFGEMSWIERNAEKRVGPQKVLANAKTVICLATSYENFSSRRSRGNEALTKKSAISDLPSAIEQSLVTSTHPPVVLARYA